MLTFNYKENIILVNKKNIIIPLMRKSSYYVRFQRAEGGVISVL